jgi:hypothetical protein
MDALARHGGSGRPGAWSLGYWRSRAASARQRLASPCRPTFRNSPSLLRSRPPTLAEIEPDAWAGGFATTKKAENALGEYREQLDYVRGAVRMSLENAKRLGDSSGKPDEWLSPSEAQYRLLTAENRAFVSNAYKAAKIAGGTGFSVASEAAQVAIFHWLGLLSENTRAALDALGVEPEVIASSSGEPVTPSTPVSLGGADQPKQQMRDRVIVATGHRADAPDRPHPGRFPNTPDCIAKARSWLHDAIETEKRESPGSIAGIGGGASGTDILFHEVCVELGIPTTIVLPIPKEDYRRESVADGGPDWVERFNRLVSANPPIVLSDNSDMPAWAESIPNYSVFQRGNIWMIEHALLQPKADVTLLALWNGKAGDGPGGTADMVKLAETHGAKICVTNTDALFGIV